MNKRKTLTFREPFNHKIMKIYNIKQKDILLESLSDQSYHVERVGDYFVYSKKIKVEDDIK